MDQENPHTEGRRHRVVALVLPGVVPFDLSVAAQVFGHRYERGRYEFTLCTERPGLVPTDMGFALEVDAGLEALARADTVIVPGFFPHDAISEPVRSALLRCHRSGARIASICAGAFALAHAGLLDGLRATTHWAKADELARRFPAVRVEPDALFVDEGRVLTGAGVAAGIDLCLHLYRLDHGVAAAAVMAKGIVAGQLRSADHVQGARRLDAARSTVVDEAVQRLLERLDEPVHVDDLARRARLSVRSFQRHFTAAVGMSPIRWLTLQRVEEAKRLLETSSLGVEQIARRCGVGGAAALRTLFAKHVGLAPSEYRRRVLAAAAEPAEGYRPDRDAASTTRSTSPVAMS